MKKYRTGNIVKMFFRIMKYSWKATPGTFLMLILGSMLVGLVQVAQIYGMQILFDAVTGLANGIIALQETYYSIWIIGVVLIMTPVASALHRMSQGHFWRRVNCSLHSMVHLKSAQLELINFETSDTFNDIEKAAKGTEEAPNVSRSSLELLFMYIPFYVFTALYLISVKPMLVLALLFVFIPVLISEMLRASAFYNLENKTASVRREMKHYDECITAARFFKETRNFGAYGFFKGLFIKSIDKYNSEVIVYEKRIAKINLLLNAVKITGYTGVLGLTVYYLAMGDISLGMFAAVFYSLEKLNTISGNMVECFGDMLKSISAGVHLFAFIDRKSESVSSGEIDKSSDITLDNITFSYPDSGLMALNGVNLKIKAGETLAIVGANGAGKTTLTKIAAGLFHPTEGSVKYGGVDIRGCSKASVYKSMSAVFQSFQKYRMTLQDNICISDINSTDGVDSAVAGSGLKVSADEFADGYETMLSREFKGIDLSGGQWQRIAIARGFFRDHEVIILDEPTAAIDPIEETHIFNTFIEAAKGKTAILVTHRLGSAKMADRIIVMAEGRIIEEGTHADLITSKGEYSRMFNEQAKWYRR